LTGFRRTGTWGKAAGHDINYLSLSGALAALGPAVPEPPLPPGNLVADFAGGGLSCALGILLALQARQKSGKGTVVEQNMVDGVQYLSTFVRHAQKGPMWGEPRGHNILDGGCPYYSCYATADGGFMAVGCLEPQFYKVFIDKLGVSNEIASIDRFDRENWPKMRDAYTARFKERTTADWCKLYDGTDACVTPVLDEIEYAGVPVSVGGYNGLPQAKTHNTEGEEDFGLECGRDNEAVLQSWLGKAKL
jgi:alpha-methylacyl-CoA racemase